MRPSLILMLALLVLSERPMINGHETDRTSWNTCEEFVNTTLPEKTLLGVKWRMFYHWGNEPDSKYVLTTFSWPLASTLDRYLALNISTVSWLRTPLYMERSDDFEGMLARTHKPGIYGVLTKAHIEDPTLPISFVGLKTAGEYLAMMNCRSRFCSLFASSDHMPVGSQVDKAVRLFNFRGGPGSVVSTIPRHSEYSDEEGFRPEYGEDSSEYV